MTEKHACIYCGNTEISESDIIPDALTMLGLQIKMYAKRNIITNSVIYLKVK